MKFKSLFLSIPLICLVACSSNDDNDEEVSQPKRTIRVEVSEIPMTDTLTNKSRINRAPITVESKLEEFFMNYYWNGDFSDSQLWTNTITTTGEWEWHPKIGNASWPQDAGNNDPVTFYAYAGVDWGHSGTSEPCFLDDDNKVKLDFTMDQNSGETKDLLVSKDVKSYSQDGTIHFTFRHACAAMQFTICKTERMSSLDIKVKEIKIHHLIDNGLFIFDPDDSNPWDLSNTYSDYTIKAYAPGMQHGAITVGLEPAALVGDGTTDYLFSIPQRITPWSGTGPVSNTYAEIVCSITKDGRQYSQNYNSDGFGSVYIPFTVDELKQSFVHHVKIVMGTALKKNDGTSIFQ